MKRSASKQPSVYEIPESPESAIASRDEEATVDPVETRSTRSITSPSMSTRGRSRSTSSSAVFVDYDATPVQARALANRVESAASKQAAVPGLQALEAVNSLYQKLKDSQAEIEHLHHENEDLSMELLKQKKLAENLQADLETEKEKVNKMQRAHEQEALSLCHDDGIDLKTTLDSLRSFSSAAFHLMPLLDVLTGAADIEYDDNTEKLYQVFKKHKPENSTE